MPKTAHCSFCGNGPQLANALAACRSIRFAFTNAKRHAGEFNMGDLEAAKLLADLALKPARK